MTNLEVFTDIVAALIVVLGVAHLCGRLIQFLGQPRVVGEMVAGVLLGPTMFGLVAPELHTSLFTPAAIQTVYVLSNLGLAFYMFLVGCELDTNMFTESAVRRAGQVALSGIVPPILLGGSCGYFLYDALSTTGVGGFEFAFFLGAALSITAFPMLARILEDQGLTDSRLGSLALLAASLDDGLAWCLLALIAAMGTDSPLLAGVLPLLGGAVFALVCVYLVRPVLLKMSKRVEQRGDLGQGEFASILLLLLVAIWATDKIGIYSVFGSFILGLCMPRGKVFQRALHGGMHRFTTTFFLPMFFTNSGLNANLSALLSPQLLGPAALIMMVAFVSKYLSCTLAMRSIGFSWSESSAVGGLFNARGLMLLIFANLGLSQGLIGEAMFSILVMTAVVTTAAAMPIFQRSLLKEKGRLDAGIVADVKCESGNAVGIVGRE